MQSTKQSDRSQTSVLHTPHTTNRTPPDEIQKPFIHYRLQKQRRKMNIFLLITPERSTKSPDRCRDAFKPICPYAHVSKTSLIFVFPYYLTSYLHAPSNSDNVSLLFLPCIQSAVDTLVFHLLFSLSLSLSLCLSNIAPSKNPLKKCLQAV